MNVVYFIGNELRSGKPRSDASRLLPGSDVEALRQESRELLLMIGKSINTVSARLHGRKIEA